MKYFFRCISVTCLVLLSLTVFAQTGSWQDVYKVKKKDTVYGIAKKYGITVEELMKANPIISGCDFKLKKGEIIFIPFHVENKVSENMKLIPESKSLDSKFDVINVGVMLPLHDVDGDGRRMIEYYRGMLMAFDELKSKGVSVSVHSWNVSANSDIRQVLLDQNVSKCDIIFGPLYSRQVKPLADFCKRNDIKLVIPFSITGNDVTINNCIFQVYQSSATLNSETADAFLERFPHHHIVFVDCNDTASNKGAFTAKLRQKLESRGILYNITNLRSSEESFAKAFSQTKPNVVVLNTGRSPELNVALAKLDGLTTTNPDLKISMFGYTEWLMYTKVYLNYFYKYDAYVPTTFYYNPMSVATSRFEGSYRTWFKTEMQGSLPRFAITGYDHAFFFIDGLHRSGRQFTGEKNQSKHVHLQTPLKFVRVGATGGMQNKAFMLVHYTNNQEIEIIGY